MEITSTKHNLMVSPNLEVWGWDVSLYLFFSGLAAGVLIVSSILSLYYRDKWVTRPVKFATVGAAILVPLAMLGLLHDLANKWNILAFYRYWNYSSTMAFGSRALLIIPPAGLLFGFCLLEDDLTGRLALLRPYAQWLAKSRVALARLSLTCGLVLGLYTGVLLSANFGRPLWNTPLLPPIFLVSGISTGTATLILMSRNDEERVRFGKLDINLMLVEGALLLLMLLNFAFTTRAAHGALMLLTSGIYGAAFWVLIFGVGLVAPLYLEQLQVRGKIADTVFPPLMVLLGGLALRLIIVFAGQASSIPN